MQKTPRWLAAKIDEASAVVSAARRALDVATTDAERADAKRRVASAERDFARLNAPRATVGVA